MSGPVRCSRGRLTYTGALAQATFRAWADSSEGRRLLERVASRIRFAPFGRMAAARRRVWRKLLQAARAKPVAVSVQRELDAYLEILETLVYAPDLPRLGVELRRLVVVPRTLVNAELYHRLDRALQMQPAFSPGEDGTPLRSWFVVTLIRSLEAAVAGARPSPRHPLPAGHDWIIVGVNEQFEWRIPFDGPAWPGHYYLLELRRISITRAVRNTARGALADLEESLPSLSRLHRADVVNKAAHLLDQPARA